MTKLKDFQGLLLRIILIVIHGCWISSRRNIRRIWHLDCMSYRMRILTLNHSHSNGFCIGKSEETCNVSLVPGISWVTIPYLWWDSGHINQTIPYALKPSSWIFITIYLRCCNEAQKFMFFVYLTVLKIMTGPWSVLKIMTVKKHHSAIRMTANT